MLLDRVAEYISKHAMLHAGDSVIVSVSGGPDSVALLHILFRLAPDLRLNLHLFHMDHGLRGEESAEDARYARHLAESMGLPSTIVALGPDYLKRMGGPIQASARRARLTELTALAGRIGASRVALAHHRDDQAETLVMRFLRGSGRRGLSGIHPVRQVGPLTLIRPLLEVPRLEIEQYCRDHELSPRLDVSNQKTDYLRNRIRLELLPHLTAAYNPALSENLSRMADLFREEDEFLDSLAREAWEQCKTPAGGAALLASRLAAVPPTIARRVVRMATRALPGEFDLGHESVLRVLSASQRHEGSFELQLPGGLKVIGEYGVLRFEAEALLEEEPFPGEWLVDPSGNTWIPELSLRIETGRSPQAAGPSVAVLDADRLPGMLAIRQRRPGDRIWPVGMEGSKKLQDILVDAKVPRSARDRVPVLVSGEEVLWVVGYRLDRRFLADESTLNPVWVRISHEHSES